MGPGPWNADVEELARQIVALWTARMGRVPEAVAAKMLGGAPPLTYAAGSRCVYIYGLTQSAIDEHLPDLVGVPGLRVLGGEDARTIMLSIPTAEVYLKLQLASGFGER